MSYPNPKGYVVPPQDMPPKGGYFFPKYRMSTLMPKGLTTYQIVFTFLGAWAFGQFALGEYSEWRSGRFMSQTAQFMAQRRLFDVLYGPSETISHQSDPSLLRMHGIEIFKPITGRDRRVETFITSVMADEKRNIVNQWRNATRDPLVAPYKVCYGPEHYTNGHVCNNYCIHPEEIKAVREINAIRNSKSKV
jgi:hypothetical protein